MPAAEDSIAPWPNVASELGGEPGVRPRAPTPPVAMARGENCIRVLEYPSYPCQTKIRASFPSAPIAEDMMKLPLGSLVITVGTSY